ncbi:MAG TPA: hypothetical protein VF334_07855, partial [Polyangia bacterium]
MDAASLARRLAALPAALMRQATLRATLEALDDDHAARLCSEIVRRGPDGAPFDVALLALTAVLDGGALGYERHAALYAAARALDDAQLGRLLLSSQPPPPGTPQPAAPLGGRELTLGERKSLARSRRREMLDRLLRDPDESVLTILLGNPRITEDDVVRLAAKRPGRGDVLAEIARSTRWAHRPRVRIALVMNPAT